MGDLIHRGVKGKDFYLNPGLGRPQKCSAICAFPDINEGACSHYCPAWTSDPITMTIPSSKITTPFSTTSNEFDRIEPYINHDLVKLGITLAVVSIAAAILLGCFFKRRRIAIFIKYSWPYNLVFKPKRGIPASPDEETGQNRIDDTCVVNVDHPDQSGGDREVIVPLLPGNRRDTDTGIQVQDGNIPDTQPVDINNDHVSTDLKRPGPTADGNELPNDEPMALEDQLEQDGTAADKIRREENEVIRGKKGTGMKFGDTKPLLPSSPARAQTVADNEQSVQTSASLTNNGEPKLVLETTKPEGNQHTINQALVPQITRSTSHNDTSVPHSTNPTRNLIHSALSEEQRRRDSTPPSDTSRASVAQDHQDDVKQSENALNGQVPFQNLTS